MHSREEILLGLKDISHRLYFEEPVPDGDLGLLVEAIDVWEDVVRPPKILTQKQVIEKDGYIWKEFRKHSTMAVVRILKGMECTPYDRPYPTAMLNWSEYGQEWRCWDKMPTDAEREAAPWEHVQQPRPPGDQRPAEQGRTEVRQGGRTLDR